MKKTVQYYISLGFEKAYAEYFVNGRRTITDVFASDNFTLIITFDNGEKKLYNVAPLITKGSVFEFLSSPQNFSRVYIDDNHCISWDINPNINSDEVWNNKVDLCPDSCYVESIPID